MNVNKENYSNDHREDTAFIRYNGRQVEVSKVAYFLVSNYKCRGKLEYSGIEKRVWLEWKEQIRTLRELAYECRGISEKLVKHKLTSIEKKTARKLQNCVSSILAMIGVIDGEHLRVGLQVVARIIDISCDCARPIYANSEKVFLLKMEDLFSQLILEWLRYSEAGGSHSSGFRQFISGKEASRKTKDTVTKERQTKKKTKQKRTERLSQSEQKGEYPEIHFLSEQADSSTVKTALLKVFVHFVDAQICGDILVVDDVEDQRIDNGVYWIGCTFLQALLKEVANGRKRYKQDGLRYTVIVKEEFPRWREARVHLLHFCGEAAETLFIYLQKSVRRADEVNYETVTAWIPFTGTKSIQPITVLYSKSQNKYFLNSQTYEEYRKNMACLLL